MNWMSKLLVVVILTLTAGITIANAEKEEEIPISKVPKEVLKAAQKAVPGIKLTEAEVEKTKKGLVYDLEGTVDGKEYEIEVSAAGKVLEIEQEGEDDKDDDEDEEENEEEQEEEDDKG